MEPLDAATLSLWWVLPFAGLLLSIALLPLLAPRLWHRHDGTVAAAWALALLLPFGWLAGLAAAGGLLLHVLMLEYLPFILVLLALYTVAGGIRISGLKPATPARNTALLALGTLIAGVIGTTGASMLLIRPLLASNAHRRRQVHLVVFFILLVGNVGGTLTPLGDPPLFLGFLKGVAFDWPLIKLTPPMLVVATMLLASFYLLDRRGPEPPPDTGPDSGAAFRVEGRRNLLLLAAIIGLVLMSGLWDGPALLHIGRDPLLAQKVMRDVGLVAAALLSLAWTPRGLRAANQFAWAPMREVAVLFAGIFLTIAPVLTMLGAGRAGALAPLVALVEPGSPWVDVTYFWLTGILSSMLDNAPTYLVLFNLAGGDPQVLMTTGARTLMAISCGAVFMGALTYFGNAPNLMIKAIAEARGVAMPSFFGFLAWSVPLLAPPMVLVTWLFFY